MEKILVAVDGSLHAEKALNITATLAKQEDAAVVVLHVACGKNISKDIRRGIEIEYAHEIEERLKAVDFRAPLPDEAQYAKAVLAQRDNVTKVVNTLAGENIIKRAAKKLHESDFDNFETLLVDGDPAERIIALSEFHKADTIVMGCRGAGKLKGLLLGSVSQSVAHEANCSVVIVK